MGGPLLFFEGDSQSYEMQIVEASRIFLAKHSPEYPKEPLKLAEPRMEIKANASHVLEISKTGNSFAIYLDNKLVHAFSDPNPLKGKFS
jgi:hypothetical protein